MNIVDELLQLPLQRRTFEERMRIKSVGRPTPDINIAESDGKKNRSFGRQWYDRYSWLTASESKSSLFCWSCVLFPAAEFGAKNDVWSAVGYSNIKNISRALKKHAESKEHVQADVRLKLMGKQRINEAIDEDVRVQN